MAFELSGAKWGIEANSNNVGHSKGSLAHAFSLEQIHVCAFLVPYTYHTQQPAVRYNAYLIRTLLLSAGPRLGVLESSG